MTYSFEDVSILVVEDNQPMLEIIKSLLSTFGVGTIYGARDGRSGFKSYCRYKPDIIISDWMMRPVDGISLARMIRNDPKSPNPYIPIILMTGFSEKRRVIQARDAGVTEFLVKPFTARDLFRRITQIIERPRQFVKSEDFFGPDRRRKTSVEYNGPLRRELDIIKTAQQKQRMKEASLALDDMRQKAGLAKGDKIDIKDPKSKDGDIIIDLV